MELTITKYSEEKPNHKRGQRQSDLPLKSGRTTLAEMAEFWVSGGNLSWEDFRTGRKPAKIALPTYPFLKTDCGYQIRRKQHQQPVQLLYLIFLQVSADFIKRFQILNII